MASSTSKQAKKRRTNKRERSERRERETCTQLVSLSRAKPTRGKNARSDEEFAAFQQREVVQLPTADGVQGRRLLRNRVSAQQARERRKAYVTELEAKVKDLEKRNSELEERLSTLQNENQMLRQILKNTTVNRTGPGSSAGGDSQ